MQKNESLIRRYFEWPFLTSWDINHSVFSFSESKNRLNEHCYPESKCPKFSPRSNRWTKIFQVGKTVHTLRPHLRWNPFPRKWLRAGSPQRPAPRKSLFLTPRSQTGNRSWVLENEKCSMEADEDGWIQEASKEVVFQGSKTSSIQKYACSQIMSSSSFAPEKPVDSELGMPEPAP